MADSVSSSSHSCDCVCMMSLPVTLLESSTSTKKSVVGSRIRPCDCQMVIRLRSSVGGTLRVWQRSSRVHSADESETMVKALFKLKNQFINW